MTARELLDRLPEDQRHDVEERAAIMEYDGGLSRDEAEQRAWQSMREAMKACGAEQ